MPGRVRALLFLGGLLGENISENTTTVPNWRFSYDYRHAAGRISSIEDLGGPNPATIPLSAAPPGASIEYPNDTTTTKPQSAFNIRKER